MRVKPQHLQRALDKVSEVDGHYRLEHIASDDPCKSVDHLKYTVEKYLEKQIRLLELGVSMSGSVVHSAFIMKSESEFDIAFVRDLPQDWRRFVVCKELFHVILDQESYRDMDIERHLEALTTTFPNDDANPLPSVLAEFLAEIAAMEFLFPRALRVREIEAGTPTREVAQRYGIPLLFVERYLSRSWMENLDPVRLMSL